MFRSGICSFVSLDKKLTLSDASELENGGIIAISPSSKDKKCKVQESVLVEPSKTISPKTVRKFSMPVAPRKNPTKKQVRSASVDEQVRMYSYSNMLHSPV